MSRHRKMILLAGLVLLGTAACASYPGSYPPPPAPAPYPAPSSSDRWIHDEVHRALERAPALRHVDLSVRVEHHNVYLSGRVYSYDQKRAAHEVAHAVDGVRRVFTRGIYVSR